MKRVMQGVVLVASVLCTALACRTPATPPTHDLPATEPGVLQRALARPGVLAEVAADAAAYRLKLALAEVVPGPDGRPTLRRESFDAGPDYWYPASTVKSCAVVAALIELDELARAAGRPITADTPLRFHPLVEGEVLYEREPSHLADGTVTVAHLARQILLVSDNPAFNRLYDLCGQDRLNRRMWAAGLDGIKIRHRLSLARTPDQNRRAPRIELLPADGEAPLELPERRSELDLGAFEGSGTLVGDAYLDGSGARIDTPMEFARRNEARLSDLLDLHVLVLRPDIDLGPRADGEPRALPLQPAHREFIRDVMRARPRDSADPAYDPERYPDDYSKFLAPGIWSVKGADAVDVLDKVGRAYGFSATNSYVEDRRTGRAFFLAGALYTNPDGVLNDDRYDYALADRFFAELGAALAEELLPDALAGSAAPGPLK